MELGDVDSHYWPSFEENYCLVASQLQPKSENQTRNAFEAMPFGTASKEVWLSGLRLSTVNRPGTALRSTPGGSNPLTSATNSRAR